MSANPAQVPVSIPARYVQPPGDTINGLRLMPGIKSQYIFVAPARNPGFYHLRFWIVASEPEQEQAEEEGAPNPGTWLWGNDFYLVVR